jgi:adenine/guanine/hypoxanthine permease
VSYLGVAGILFYLSRYAEFHPVAADMHGAAAEAD